MAIDINALIKQYTNPWDTSYNYVDASGNVLGKGYDSYEDAIRKLAFTSGLQTYAAQPATAPSGDHFFNGDPGQGQPWNPGSAATPEQYGWNQYQDHPEFRFAGIGVDPGQDTNFVAPSGTPRFNTKQELYDYLMAQPGDALSYESKEKYGRDLTEGQLQNMYARYASGNLVGAVPDWTYHREAYNTQNAPGVFAEAPKGGYRIAGEQALVGSTPVFGDDGKIVGYKINLSPEHINLSDTSGRVQSSTNGATLFDTSLKDFAVPMGDGTAFVKSEDIGKLAYSSTGNSTYSKDPNFFDKYMPGIIQSAALGGTLAGLGGAFNGAGAATGTGAAAGSTGGNMSWIDEMLSNLSGDDLVSQWTDVPDWFGGSGTEYASQNIVDLFNNAGMEGFNQYGVSWDDLATQLFDQAGTAGFDQYGNEAFGLDWLKSQIPSGTSSDTLAKLGKVLFGEGGTGAAASGGLLGGTGTGQGSLLGALLGGLAGSYGGAKQDGTINTTQTPWGPQQPYLLDAWEKAKQASNNPINTQAQSNYQQVLQGPTTNPYLGQDNPYLQKQIDNTNADVTRAMMPAMTQANKASGSFGNSGVADIYSKNMTDAYSRNANDMRFKDYYTQMQLQKDAVNNTLGFTQGTSNFLAGPAQDYAKTVQGNYGGTKSEPYFTNPASSILGGATLGYNLFGR